MFRRLAKVLHTVFKFTLPYNDAKGFDQPCPQGE